MSNNPISNSDIDPSMNNLDIDGGGGGAGLTSTTTQENTQEKDYVDIMFTPLSHGVLEKKYSPFDWTVNDNENNMSLKTGILKGEYGSLCIYSAENVRIEAASGCRILGVMPTVTYTLTDMNYSTNGYIFDAPSNSRATSCVVNLNSSKSGSAKNVRINKCIINVNISNNNNNTNNNSNSNSNSNSINNNVNFSTSADGHGMIMVQVGGYVIKGKLNMCVSGSNYNSGNNWNSWNSGSCNFGNFGDFNNFNGIGGIGARPRDTDTDCKSDNYNNGARGNEKKKTFMVFQLCKENCLTIYLNESPIMLVDKNTNNLIFFSNGIRIENKNYPILLKDFQSSLINFGKLMENDKKNKDFYKILETGNNVLNVLKVNAKSMRKFGKLSKSYDIALDKQVKFEAKHLKWRLKKEKTIRNFTQRENSVKLRNRLKFEEIERKKLFKKQQRGRERAQRQREKEQARQQRERELRRRHQNLPIPNFGLSGLARSPAGAFVVFDHDENSEDEDEDDNNNSSLNAMLKMPVMGEIPPEPLLDERIKKEMVDTRSEMKRLYSAVEQLECEMISKIDNLSHLLATFTDLEREKEKSLLEMIAAAADDDDDDDVYDDDDDDDDDDLPITPHGIRSNNINDSNVRNRGNNRDHNNRSRQIGRGVRNDNINGTISFGDSSNNNNNNNNNDQDGRGHTGYHPPRAHQFNQVHSYTSARFDPVGTRDGRGRGGRGRGGGHDQGRGRGRIASLNLFDERPSVINQETDQQSNRGGRAGGRGKRRGGY